MEYPHLISLYYEAAIQLLEQAPRSPEYVPDPMELEDHVPVYILEPGHPEDLVPAKDEAPTPLLPPSFLSPWTPLLLPIPPPAPSTSRRAEIPEADTPPRKRILLTTPRHRSKVGESSAAAVARQPGPTMAHGVDCSFVDTIETRRDKLAYEQESIENPHALASVRATNDLANSAYHKRNLRPYKLEQRVDTIGDTVSSFLKNFCYDCSNYAVCIIFLRLKKMAQNEPQGQHRAALAARDANRNGVDNILTRTGIRDLNACYESVTYQDYHECKPLHEIHRKHSKLQNPKTMQETVEMATELMDNRVSTIAERQAENKRKFENTSRNNQNQQQQNKRQNTDRAYTAGSGDKKQYGGSRPLCSRCNYHHDGPYAPKCYKCNKFGHIARDFQGHFKKECPKLKNNKGNRGNQDGRDTALAKVYAVGRARTNPDSNIVTDHYYDVELADGRIIGLNTILRGCTLNLLNHPFNINLMPVELGSFDAIIGMDWLAKYQAIIVCAEKIVQYMLKGCPLFLAHVTTNEVEDKSKKKRLADVPIVRDFPEVFPEDLSGLPPTRQVEFQIDFETIHCYKNNVL
ncbi:putative reverse transcriptase domain-containing protein [Tanacetum coccineum]